jgi:preprotein translocase subunit SecG
LDKLQFLLDREVDEIGIHEYGVGWAEGFVVLEEEGGGNLRAGGALANHSFAATGWRKYISRTISLGSFFSGGGCSFFLRRASREAITRLTAANLRVFLALPIVSVEVEVVRE